MSPETPEKGRSNGKVLLKSALKKLKENMAVPLLLSCLGEEVVER